jgi:hypothetical protein
VIALQKPVGKIRTKKKGRGISRKFQKVAVV